MPKRVAYEAKFHRKLMLHLKYNLDKFPPSFLIETKVVRPDCKNFSYRELSEKERLLLKLAKHQHILATNSDLDRLGTVCDGYCLSGGAYVFIQWIRPGNKEFFAIDIDMIINEIDSGSKSLTQERAMAICSYASKIK